MNYTADAVILFRVDIVFFHGTLSVQFSSLIQDVIEETAGCNIEAVPLRTAEGSWLVHKVC